MELEGIACGHLGYDMGKCTRYDKTGEERYFMILSQEPVSLRATQFEKRHGLEEGHFGFIVGSYLRLIVQNWNSPPTLLEFPCKHKDKQIH